jgi:inosine-uridine nucleoside N-ribohydrolase
MFRSLLVSLCLAACAATVMAAEKRPIILDTDIGSDVDDAYALALAIACPEFDLLGVTTVSGDTTVRAKIALRMLHAAGMPKVPVAAGGKPQVDQEVGGQYQYYYHPAVIFNRAGQPQKQTAVEWMHATLKDRQDKVTLVAVGPLTNIARLLKDHPELKSKIDQIVLMGGSVRVNYQGQPKPEPEWNIKLDIPAAKAVFSSGIPLTVVPLDATYNLKFTDEYSKKFFAKNTMLTMQCEALQQMWNQGTPTFFDILAVAAGIDDSFSTWEKLKIGVDDMGMTKEFEAGAPNARVAMKSDPAKFLNWYVERVGAYGKTSLPRPLKNESKLIEDDRFPAHVHVYEDYETDIEKRWWLTGRLIDKDAPQGKRAIRSHLTLDFDDLQGQLDTMYSAVVFNPVPGPPMGPRTRLRFRYKLEGTDELRVQLYSLTNGYHRYLSVKGLPQNKWQSAVVDMTQMRRPDGSGGPLAKDERIDDIQFLVDPRATVYIDDVYLYDGGDENEKRKWPDRIVFTGWFDSGKQGGEWPGEFEIAAHDKPLAWKFAKSVVKEGQPVLNVGLRGERTLMADPSMDLRYRIEGKPERPIVVELANSKTGVSITAPLPDAESGKWVMNTLALKREASAEVKIDVIRFKIPEGVTLSIDDLLLYEPAK